MKQIKVLLTLTILTLLTLASSCSGSGLTGGTVATTSDLSFPDSTEYTLDTTESTLRYAAYKISGSGHEGYVTIKNGNLVRNKGEFTGGFFTIDMSTITEDGDNERYIAHVMSEDFFNVAKYPTSTFIIKEITQDIANQFLVSGDLTILGNTNRIEFPATLSQEGETLNLQASFEIDRTKWGITYNSGNFVKGLGDKAIKDEIEFILDLDFTN